MPTRTFEIIEPQSAPIPMVVHVPHSSTNVPSRFLTDFAVSRDELETELRLMTDHHTDELAGPGTGFGATTFVNRVSRLVMDPERFREDSEEPMAQRGMGAIYVSRHDGSPLRKPGFSDRDRIVDELYVPYHHALETLVGGMLQAQRACVIVDLHSFPKDPLGFEDASRARPAICIGFDDFHVDEELRARWAAQIRERGLDVTFNEPFAGSIVPSKFYRQDRRVRSLMIEVRRDLYMNEATGEKAAGFDDVSSLVGSLLESAAMRVSKLSVD